MHVKPVQRMWMDAQSTPRPIEHYHLGCFVFIANMAFAEDFRYWLRPRESVSHLTFWWPVSITSWVIWHSFMTMHADYTTTRWWGNAMQWLKRDSLLTGCTTKTTKDVVKGTTWTRTMLTRSWDCAIQKSVNSKTDSCVTWPPQSASWDQTMSCFTLPYFWHSSTERKRQNDRNKVSQYSDLPWACPSNTFWPFFRTLFCHICHRV